MKSFRKRKSYEDFEGVCVCAWNGTGIFVTHDWDYRLIHPDSSPLNQNSLWDINSHRSWKGLALNGILATGTSDCANQPHPASAQPNSDEGRVHVSLEIDAEDVTQSVILFCVCAQLIRLITLAADDIHATFVLYHIWFFQCLYIWSCLEFEPSNIKVASFKRHWLWNTWISFQ